MEYKLNVYSVWEFGQRKDSQGNPHQEDSIFPQFGKESENDRLFILCDGMGGHDAGEVASATVCEAMSRSILNNGRDKDGLFSINDFNNAIDDAFCSLDKKDNGAEKKMGTTMTFLKLHKGGAFIAHMGDSRVYHIRPGKDGDATQILFETYDHSLVNDLIKIGELTKEEAKQSKQKNVITRAMQPNMSRKPKADIYQTADIKPGDYFYMCSDGMLEQPEMEDGTSLKNVFSELGGNDENKIEILKSVTEKNRDNHTAFIVHILEVENPIENTVSKKTVTQITGDKFTAIVEDNSDNNANADTAQFGKSTKGIDISLLRKENESASASMPIIGNSKYMDSQIKKSFLSTVAKNKNTISIVFFLLSIIIIMLIISNSICFKSYLYEENKPPKEKTEHPIKERKPRNGGNNKAEKPTNVESEQSNQAPAQVAVEVVNSAVSVEENVQMQNHPQNTIVLPSKIHKEDVVDSDEQAIINQVNNNKP